MINRTSRRPRWPWALLACTLLACTAAEERPLRSSQPAAIRIPFTLTSADNIAVRATLNGTDALELMFHTAVDSVSLTKSAISRLSSFTASESIPVQSWGGTTQARHSTGNSLQIGALAWHELAITEGDNSGPGTDGKFGPNLFAGKIVEINFDARELLIHPALPPMDASFQRLDLLGEHGDLSVMGEFTVGQHSYKTTFLLHTGVGGTALLDEEFLRTHNLGTSLETLSESVLKDSYGNEVKTRKVRLPALRFGATTFVDVPVGIFEGKIGSKRTSIVGAGLLKRFNLIIDAENRQLYMSPSKLLGTEFAPAASAPAGR